MGKTIEIDLREYDFDSEPARVEDVKEGWHELVISGVDKGETGKGDPKLIVNLKSANGLFEGRLQSHIPLTGRGLFKAVELLTAVGIKTEPRNYKFSTDKLTGKKVHGEIVHDEWDGRTIASVQRLRPPGSAPVSSAEQPHDAGEVEESGVEIELDVDAIEWD